MASSLAFPTPLHQQVAELTHDFFTAHAQVDTVVVVILCARRQATPESDLIWRRWSCRDDGAGYSRAGSYGATSVLRIRSCGT
jgi:hypothetical protein